MSDPIHVLIVDDDDDVREALEIILGNAGYAVTTAADGAQALERLRTANPLPVVLLDLRMPVMSGWEVIDALRAESRLPGMRILICTSSPRDSPPGFEVIAKPVDLRKLTAAIDRLAQRD